MIVVAQILQRRYAALRASCNRRLRHRRDPGGRMLLRRFVLGLRTLLLAIGVFNLAIDNDYGITVPLSFAALLLLSIVFESHHRRNQPGPGFRRLLVRVNARRRPGTEKARRVQPAAPEPTE